MAVEPDYFVKSVNVANYGSVFAKDDTVIKKKLLILLLRGKNSLPYIQTLSN